MLKPTMASIDNWALVGLRTLLLAKRELSVQQYESWNEELTSMQLSKMNQEGKNQHKMGMYAKMETDLTLVGATAVEDKL